MASEQSNTTQYPWIEKIPWLNKLLDLLPGWMRQAVKFGLVGVINTGVDLGLYWVLTRLVFTSPDLSVVAKAISYTAGVINSYFWNRNFTFHSKNKTLGGFILFFSINLVAIGINSGVMWLGLNRLHVSELISLLMATAFTMVWNFLTSKFIVFKQ